MRRLRKVHADSKDRTEFEVSLIQKDGFDTLTITASVKWNITSSPYNMHHAKSQTEALTQVLAKYCPNPNVTKAETWSPQDFYQSVVRSILQIIPRSYRIQSCIQAREHSLPQQLAR